MLERRCIQRAYEEDLYGQACCLVYTGSYTVNVRACRGKNVWRPDFSLPRVHLPLKTATVDICLLSVRVRVMSGMADATMFDFGGQVRGANVLYSRSKKHLSASPVIAKTSRAVGRLRLSSSSSSSSSTAAAQSTRIYRQTDVIPLVHCFSHSNYAFVQPPYWLLLRL